MCSLVSHLEQLSSNPHYGKVAQQGKKPTSLCWTREVVSGRRTQLNSQPTPPLLPSPPQEYAQPLQQHNTSHLTPLVSDTPVHHFGPYLVQVLPSDTDHTHSCIDTRTGRTLTCRQYNLKTFHEKAHLFFPSLEGVHPILDIQIVGKSAYIVSEPTYGDLHQYLRQKRRLSEAQAAPLFRQLVCLVQKAHERGIALRDIKLKKIVFEDQERCTLSLLHLDDAHQMDHSGQLTDRHGCPAYVSPEMLQPGSYSGRAADLWSLGVILYTLLVGHYPFFDNSPQNLFSKVRSGYYTVPDTVSYLARSLICSLLAYDPEKRVPAIAILDHPWFTQAHDQEMLLMPLPHTKHGIDQTVPKCSI